MEHMERRIGQLLMRPPLNLYSGRKSSYLGDAFAYGPGEGPAREDEPLDTSLMQRVGGGLHRDGFHSALVQRAQRTVGIERQHDDRRLHESDRHAERQNQRRRTARGTFRRRPLRRSRSSSSSPSIATR